jgi:hypothetical protein
MIEPTFLRFALQGVVIIELDEDHVLGEKSAPMNRFPTRAVASL